MKHIVLTCALVLSLSACQNTWNGAKKDSSQAYEKTTSAVEKGLDKTGEVLKKGAHAVGTGLEKTGEFIKEKTE